MMCLYCHNFVIRAHYFESNSSPPQKKKLVKKEMRLKGNYILSKRCQMLLCHQG